MIKIKDLNGTYLKKDLCIERVIKRYHNRNKSGGNFGINLMTGKSKNFELNGNHDTNDVITSLYFTELYHGVGERIISFRHDENIFLTYNMLIPMIKNKIKKELGD